MGVGGGESIHIPQVTGRCAGWGRGLGGPKAGGRGGLGLEKSLTMGQLEGGEEAPRQGASGVPSRAGPP